MKAMSLVMFGAGLMIGTMGTVIWWAVEAGLDKALHVGVIQ